MGFTALFNFGALRFRSLNAILERPETITRDHRSYVHTGSNAIGRQSAAHAESTNTIQNKLVNLIILRCMNKKPLDANAILACILAAILCENIATVKLR